MKIKIFLKILGYIGLRKGYSGILISLAVELCEKVKFFGGFS